MRVRLLFLVSALLIAVPADARQDVGTLLDRYAAGDSSAARVADVTLTRSSRPSSATPRAGSARARTPGRAG